ncbi:MAG: NUDIX domain-containing protein [Nitrospirota bacterium]
MSERPFLTVDCVVFHGNAVVLIRRAHDPFKGWYALPGGFVEVGETVEEACRRETREETGLIVEDLRLIGVYSDPARDPRRHTVSVAFHGRADIASLEAGDDASAAELVADWQHAQLAFDHQKILSDAWRLYTGEERCGSI